eukprot:354362-Chlamydomonas_euryale.AAC.1
MAFSAVDSGGCTVWILVVAQQVDAGGCTVGGFWWLHSRWLHSRVACPPRSPLLPPRLTPGRDLLTPATPSHTWQRLTSSHLLTPATRLTSWHRLTSGTSAAFRLCPLHMPVPPPPHTWHRPVLLARARPGAAVHGLWRRDRRRQHLAVHRGRTRGKADLPPRVRVPDQNAGVDGCGDGSRPLGVRASHTWWTGRFTLCVPAG